MVPKKRIVRCYMISGFDFASRDQGSASDPYLELICNDKKFSERSNYQVDEPNPDFYKSYDFPATFPGCGPLIIKAWDYDVVFGDELIGETIVDLEDRFFSNEWNAIYNHQIELRQLYHPSSSMSQGVVKTWIEIVAAN